MKKPTKVAVAAALGASLLISGSTYALWSSSVNPGTAASILTGDSAINALDSGVWTDLVQNQPILDISSFRAAPGDNLGFQQDFNVKFSGGPTMKNKLQLKFADDSGLDPSSLKARGIIVQATLTDLDSGKTSTSDLNTSSLTTGFTFTGSLPAAGDRVRVTVNFKINSDVTAEDTKKLQSLVSSSQLNIFGVVDPKAEAVASLEYPVSRAFTYQLKATGTPAPTWSLVSGSLPAGVTLSPSGVLSGTPTAASQSTITARATNDAGSVDVKFNLSVVEPVVFQTTSLPDFSVNVPYSQQLEASGNPTFAVTSGSLPQGVTLSSGGLISGLPTTNAYSQTAFTITATGANGTASKSFVINLVTPQFGMNNPVGYEYVQQVIPMNITGLGKESDLTIAFTNNTSPSPYIQISGTNLVLTSNLRAGAYSFGLTASNKTGATLTKGYTVNVKASSTIQWSNNSTVTAASVANSPRYYNFQFYYNPSTTITVKSGALPDGVTIDPSGKIYGYMKTSGTYTAVLQSGAQTMTVKFVG